MLRTSILAAKQRAIPALALAMLCGFCLALSAESALAAARALMLNPVRVIFTDRQRTMEVHVANPSQETVTYAIGIVTMRKDAHGQLREVTDETEAERQVRSMIRYAPRRATIEPGKRQVVKLMVNKPADLPAGEYQTRLKLSPLPAASAPSPSAEAARGGTALNLEILVDSTFPIIIQHGNIAATVNPVALVLKQAADSPSGMVAEVRFSRSGNGSAFGNVFVQHLPANNPKAAREIGQVQGMVIYLPEAERTMRIPLANISRQELAAGTLRVSFVPGTGSTSGREQPGQRSSRDFPLP